METLIPLILFRGDANKKERDNKIKKIKDILECIQSTQSQELYYSMDGKGFIAEAEIDNPYSVVELIPYRQIYQEIPYLLSIAPNPTSDKLVCRMYKPNCEESPEYKADTYTINQTVSMLSEDMTLQLIQPSRLALAKDIAQVEGISGMLAAFQADISAVPPVLKALVEKYSREYPSLYFSAKYENCLISLYITYRL